MKKLMLTAVIYGFLGSFFLRAQTTQTNQVKEAIIGTIEDVVDYAFLTAQTINLVDRTAQSLKRLDMIRRDSEELVKLMAGGGVRNYFKRYGKDKLVKDRIKMISLQVTSLMSFSLTINNLSKDFIKSIAKKGARVAAEKGAIIADGTVRGAAAVATAGAAAIIDFTPISNAVTLMKGQQAKESVKRFLFELISMLEKLNEQVDKAYDDIMDVRKKLIRLNDVGLAMIGPGKYTYRKGVYNMVGTYDERKAKRKKEAEKKLKEAKEKALKDKVFPVYTIKIY